MYDFLVDRQYTRKDIYGLIGLPETTRGGNWDTGYNKFNNDYFIFANIGVPGRTGHDYENRFDGSDLYWHAKSNTRLDQPQIQELLNPPRCVFVFFRRDNNSPFTFAGTARPKSHQDTTPVQITWEIDNTIDSLRLSNETLRKFKEGSRIQVVTNAYERNPDARRRCVSFYGYLCSVCGFDFEKVYGDLGKDFIHVHHLKPVSEIGEEYEIDPIQDLRPVCPNCHAMLHRGRTTRSIAELRLLIDGQP